MPQQQYVRQVKPRNESYIPPVDKIQTFLAEGDTKDATDMESVIVACWNNRNLKEAAFVEAVGDKGIYDSTSKKLYNIPKKIKDPQNALWKFSQLLKKFGQTLATGDATGAGTKTPATSAFWEFHTRKTKDTSAGRQLSFTHKSRTPKREIRIIYGWCNSDTPGII